MSGYQKILTTLSTLVFKAKNNPDFAAAVFIGYGVMGLQIIVQVFLVPLYLQAFGAYRFGALMILVGYTGFAFALASSLYSILLRLFSEALKSMNEAATSSLYVAGKLLFMGVGLVCSLVLLAIELVHSILFDDAPTEFRGEIVGALLLSLLHLLLLCELAVDQTLLAALRRQAFINLVTMVGLVSFGITVVPALLLGADLDGVMTCFIVGDIVSRLFAAFYLRRHIRVRWRQPWEGIAHALRQILMSRARQYFGYTAMTIVLQADVIIVGLIDGPLAAAKFVLVWKIAELATMVLSRVTQQLQAEFVRMDMHEERGRLARIYREFYGGLLAAALGMALLYGLFGHWIVAQWVGEASVPPEPWAYPLAGLTVLWLGMARLPISLALSLHRITPLVRLVGVELAGKLILVLLLFPHVGYLAPIIAISLVHVCGIAYGYYRLGRSTVVQLDPVTAA